MHDFYPRSPCGERRYSSAGCSGSSYFYPRSPCGERLSIPGPTAQEKIYFYPRSPCGERQQTAEKHRPALKISIHALLAESDIAEMDKQHRADNFYPRSPCGERPKLLSISIFIHAFLSTLSLRRATQTAKADRKGKRDFYPRSPCGERLLGNVVAGLLMLFLSTLSLRRATCMGPLIFRHQPHFYPRSPCGERPQIAHQ